MSVSCSGEESEKWALRNLGAVPTCMLVCICSFVGMGMKQAKLQIMVLSLGVESWFDFNFHLDVTGCQLVSEDNKMLSLCQEPAESVLISSTAGVLLGDVWK